MSEYERAPIEGSRHFLRGSVILLGLRVVGLLILVEALFALAVSLLYLNETSLAAAFASSPVLLWSLYALKIVLLVVFLLRLVLDWATTIYYIGDHHLVKYHGILERDENVYNLQSLRTVRLHQHWLSRLLNYGDLYLIFSASGYRDELWLRGILNAHHYEQVLRSYLMDTHDKLAAREEEGPAAPAGRP